MREYQERLKHYDSASQSSYLVSLSLLLTATLTALFL
jgi:hypothetical protein